MDPVNKMLGKKLYQKYNDGDKFTYKNKSLLLTKTTGDLFEGVITDGNKNYSAYVSEEELDEFWRRR